MQEDKNLIFQMRFPQKLWYLLNLHPDAILWGGTGRTILLNYRILKNYLQCDHSVFKTTNISSFVRQLNLYGFRKVTSHLQDPLCNSSNPYMHEYVHDYFQYGRPELLNKITRKALTMKRTFKPKNSYNNVEQLFYFTPLQKARHALRMALKKAAQELLSQDSPTKQLHNMQLKNEDSQDDFYEDEESYGFDWLSSNNKTIINTQTKSRLEPVISDKLKGHVEENVKKVTEQIQGQVKTDGRALFGDPHQDTPRNFSNVSCQDNAFSAQFLSMPDLASESTATKSEAELLAGFNIDVIDDGINTKYTDNEHGSLNCVLPSISNDQNDDIVINETNVNIEHYNGEWDEMFNDNQECGSELKELYSQISKTIDLLNS